MIIIYLNQIIFTDIIPVLQLSEALRHTILRTKLLPNLQLVPVLNYKRPIAATLFDVDNRIKRRSFSRPAQIILAAITVFLVLFRTPQSILIRILDYKLCSANVLKLAKEY